MPRTTTAPPPGSPFTPDRADATAPPDPRRTVARGYDAQFHGTAELRGADVPLSTYYERGRFGRMFAGLPRYRPDPFELMRLGAVGGPMDARDDAVGPTAANPNNRDHPGNLPAGFTFLGQFLDHDITFDPTSSLERQVDPEAIANFRTPTLELDSVYAGGPGATPYLYQRGARDKLLLGRDTADGENDLPRNAEGSALVGDPRNDENMIVSQLHVAFLKFHNAAVEQVRALVPAGRSLFEEAQRVVRWHYQHMIVHEFLPAVCGQATVDDVLRGGRVLYRWRNEPFIPVEFSVAAYRFGHSQVRPGYALNGTFGARLFPAPPAPGAPAGPPAPSLGGGQRLDGGRVIEWRRFFDRGGPAGERQIGKRFDAKISTPLLQLPFAAGTPEDPPSLAQRNLMRGRTFGLPSGQAIANAVRTRVAARTGAPRVEPLEPGEMPELEPFGLARETPAWYYLLREADLRADGRTLGPVGARIVAEVFVGLLEGDPMSYLSASREWRPFLGTTAGRFTMADLLSVAGAR